MQHYLHRHLESQIKEAFGQSKVVLLIGARQVGKSTLLKNIFPDMPFFVLDPISDTYNLKTQADLFLKSFPSPIILDEVQFYPEVLASIKRWVDNTDQMGQYILTGSQNFSMLKNVSESMAGRVSIIHLDPMTFLELYGISDPLWVEPYLNDKPLLSNLKSISSRADSLPQEKSESIFHLLWRGFMPGLIGKSDNFVKRFFDSYIQTYVERDVRILADVRNLSDFSRFVRLLAMKSGQEINFAELGRELGIANSTAIQWKDFLVHSFLWKELLPYHGNSVKRLSKKSKGIFCDTGLLCHLSMIHDPISLLKHPYVGAIFETFVINTLLDYLNAYFWGCSFYHWRTSHGQEVDLIIEYKGRLYPIEIKFKVNLTSADCKGLKAFRETYSQKDIAPGIIIYTGDTCRYISENIIAVPWNSCS